MTTPALNDDLAEQLRETAIGCDHMSEHGLRDLCNDAATALETLAAENAALRSALEPFAEAGKAMLLTGGRNPKISGPRLAEHLERARTTLTGAR